MRKIEDRMAPDEPDTVSRLFDSGIRKPICPAATHLTENGTRVAPTTLKKRLGKLQPPPVVVEALDDCNRLRMTYALVDATYAVNDLATMTEIPASGIYIDPASKIKFATVTAIATGAKISALAVRRRLPGIKKMRARNYLGKPVWIYDINAVRKRLGKELLDARQSRTVKVNEQGYYENAEGRWYVIKAFFESLSPAERGQTSVMALRRRANKDCRFLDALDREEKPNCKVYLLTDLQKLSILKQERKVDANGMYTDPETNQQWASLSTWQRIFRVTHHAMEHGINKTFGDQEVMAHLKVFSGNKREDNMFRRDEIEQALAYIFEAENLEVNGVCTTIEEVGDRIRESIHLTAEELAEIIPVDRVSRKQIQRKLGAHMFEATDRESGVPRQVFSLEAALAEFHKFITDILGNMESTNDDNEIVNEQGRWLTLGKYLQNKRQQNQAINNQQFLASTDNIPRVHRKNSKNEIIYLYLESDLERITESLELTKKAD